MLVMITQEKVPVTFTNTAGRKCKTSRGYKVNENQNHEIKSVILSLNFNLTVDRSSQLWGFLTRDSFVYQGIVASCQQCLQLTRRRLIGVNLIPTCAVVCGRRVHCSQVYSCKCLLLVCLSLKYFSSMPYVMCIKCIIMFESMYIRTYVSVRSLHVCLI